MRRQGPAMIIAAIVLGMVLAVGGSVYATTVGSSVTVSSVLSVAAGTAAAPTLTFSSDTDTGLFDVSTDILGFATGGTQRAQFTNSGAFGMGTTSPGGFFSLTTATTSPGVLVTYTGTGPAFYLEDVANDTTPFVIAADGNVGIGTTTASSIFSVGQQGVHPGLWYTGYFGVGTSTPGAMLAIATSTQSTQSAFLVSNLGTGFTAWLEDAANDTSPFTIDASGNLGIGTSTPPSVLSVRGDGNNSGLWFNGYLGVATSTPGGMLAIATSTQSTQTALLVSNLGTGFGAWFEDEANDTSPLTIDAAGNLGIGTTSPGTVFGIQKVASFASATSTIESALRVNSFTATSTTATSTISTGGFQVGQAGALAAFTVGQSATTSVGVGTSTPTSHQFAVGGNALIGAGSNGTSTLAISSSGAGVGSCIQLRGASSTDIYRLYIGHRGGTTDGGSGGDQGKVPLVIELGSCR